MATDTFYATMAQLSFTLLGLWWAVVQFRHKEWMRDEDHQWMAYGVALHFLLPGIMSLISLLATDAPLVWRLTFVVAGISGVLAMVLLRRGTADRQRAYRLVRYGQLVAVPLYVGVVIVALSPDLTRNAAIGLSPLQTEGIMLSVLVFLGVNLAWSMFAAAGSETEGGA